MSDIFHSEPARGAVVIDATGQDCSIEFELTSSAGHHFDFTIYNRDVIFKPSQEINGPGPKFDKEAFGLVATVRVIGPRQPLLP